MTPMATTKNKLEKGFAKEGALVSYKSVLTETLRNYESLRANPCGSASFAQVEALVEEQGRAIGISLEDFSKWYLIDESIARYLNVSLEFINDYMGLPKCGEIEAAFLATIVHDILAFASLEFAKVISEKPNTVHPGQYTFEKEMCRLSIHVLSGEMLLACLCEICFCLARRASGICLKTASLLNHISVDSYTLDVPIEQRMLLISLANVSYNMRAKVLSDPLFQQVKSSPNLMTWMLACSGSDEQYFLNTCDTASSCTSLISRHSTICNLLVLARLVLREIRNQNDSLSQSEPAFPSYWSSYVPSVRLYVNSCANDVENLIDQIEKQATHILNERPTSSCEDSTNADQQQNKYQQPTLLKLFKLTRDWNYAMQVLSSIFAPHNPIVLTRKPFSERWHLSALVMWVLCSMTRFFPGQPASDARTRSAHEITQIRPHLYHTFRTQVTQYEDDSVFQDFAQRVRDKEPKIQLKMVKFLWKKTLKRGGLLYSSREYVKGVGSIGHLNVMFASVFQTENLVADGAEEEYLTNVRKKVFLISDPEICNFKVLTLLQMFELLCNVQYNLNLLDVVGRIRG